MSSHAENGLTFYVDSEGVVRDPEGFVVGPDVWIDGKPYGGTPLREDDVAGDAE